MVDARLVALALGVLPFVALLLYWFRNRIAANQGIAWGVLIGVVAFLGLSHAMAVVLVDHPLLSIAAGEGVALAVLVGGIAVGLAAAWPVLRRAGATEAPRVPTVAWAAAAFLGLHSFGDGLILGESVLIPGFNIPVDAVTVGGTVIHRFAEGALVAIPAVLAVWGIGKALGALTPGLLVLPGVALVAAVFQAAPPGEAFVIDLVVRSLAAGAEAGFSLVLVLAGFVPLAMASGRMRWALWAAAGFLGIALIHGLVE